MKKRNLRLFILLIMVSSIMIFGAVQVSAAEVVAQGECGVSGDNVRWSLDADGLLTISGNGAMMDFSYSSRPSFETHKTEIERVRIEQGVTHIGNNAFYQYSEVTGSLTIPDGVTTIGANAFDGCMGFTGELTIPDGVTGIGPGAFSGCSGLTGSLVIPDGVTSIWSQTFSGCSGFMGSLTIPDGVTIIGMEAFSGCSGFTGMLTIPDSVTRIDQEAFSGCNGFTGSLVIPDEVTIIAFGAFDGCGGLTGALELPDGVTTIEQNAFLNCSRLTGELTLPESVTTIGQNAFRGCWGFTGDLRIPEDVTVIECGAFYGCRGFNGHLILPEKTMSIKEHAFDGCSGLTGDLRIPDGVTTIGANAFDGCVGFTGDLTIPDSTTTIGDGAFYQCWRLSNVIIPESTKMIDRGAFGGTNATFHVIKGSYADNFCTGMSYTVQYLYEPSIINDEDYLKFNNTAINVKNSDTIPLADYVLVGDNVGNYSVNIENEDVAFYDCGSGLLAGIETGTTTITISAEGLSDTATITVLSEQEDPDIEGVGFSNNNIRISKGEKAVNLPVFTPNNTSQQGLAWTSSDNSVAIVENGLVTGVEVGSAIITAQSTTDRTVKAAFTVTVQRQQVEAIIKLPNENLYQMIRDTSKHLSYYVYPYNADNRGDITFESSDPDIIEIDEGGLMTAVGNGTATITAKIGEVEQDFEITSTAPLKGISLNKGSTSLYLGETEELSVSYDPEYTTDSKEVSWVSSNPAAATVNNGVVRGTGKGVAMITATVGDYSATCSVICKTRPLQGISLSQNETSVAIGSTETLSITYDPENTTDSKTATWESSDDGIVSVDDGVLTGVAEGDAIITATVGSFSAECFVHCAETAPLVSVVLSDSEKTLTRGESCQLTASPNPANTTDDKTVTWSSDDETVATVSASGLVETLKTGTANITATIGQKEAVCEVIVVKAAPAFDVPEGIEANCNDTLASVALPNGFAWTDDSESVGAAGDKTFTATFTPEDTEQYAVVEDVEIPVTVKHSFSQEFSKDNREHWHECVCGEKSEVENHVPEVIPAVPATCAETGLTEGAKCSVCDEVLVEQQEIPATGHTLAQMAASAATCTDPGNNAYWKCDECGSCFVDVEQGTEGAIRIDDAYYKEVTENSQVIPATGHDWKAQYYWTGNNESCIGIAKCENDPTHLIMETALPASEITTAATCETTGVNTFTAAFTNTERFTTQTKTEEIPATGHTEEVIPGTAATCTESGLSDGVKCSVCKETLTAQEVIPALDHAYTDVVIDPTCTQKGYTLHVCGRCGDHYQDAETPATGHTFGDWTDVETATCTHKGSQQRECIVCHYIETQGVDKAEHKWAADYSVDQPANCTTDGSESIKCTNAGCEAVKISRVIPATDHAWNAPTYAWAGNNGSVTATRVCGNDASHTETETAKATAKVTKAATYTAKGQTTYTAVFKNAAFKTQSKILTNIPMLTKKTQPMTVKSVTKKVKVKKLKKKAQTIAPITVKRAQGKVTYKLAGGNKKSKKALKLNTKNGKITVKKKTKKGTYSIKVKVSAAGTTAYKAGSKTVTVTVKVK